MSVYKVELRTHFTNATDVMSGRFPSFQELKNAIDGYMVTGQGIVVIHKSLFDYRYDTESADYHKVDSAGIVGHILDTIIINNSGEQKVYLIIEFNDSFSVDKHYILYYRATMQTDPTQKDHRLHFTNLFVVDLITVLDKELTDNIQLSSVEDYSTQWQSRLRKESALREMGVD